MSPMYTCNGQSLAGAGLPRQNGERDTKCDAMIDDDTDDVDAIGKNYAPPNCDATSRENVRVDVINGGAAYEKNGNNGHNGHHGLNGHPIDVNEMDSHRMFEKKSNQLNKYYNQLNAMNGYTHTNGPPLLNQINNNNNNNNAKNNHISYGGQNCNNTNIGRNESNGVKCDAYQNANGLGATNGTSGPNGCLNGVNGLNGHNQLGLPSSPPSFTPPLLHRKPVLPLPPTAPNGSCNGNSRKSYIITNGHGAQLANGKCSDESATVESRKGRFILAARFLCLVHLT